MVLTLTQTNLTMTKQHSSLNAEDINNLNSEGLYEDYLHHESIWKLLRQPTSPMAPVRKVKMYVPFDKAENKKYTMVKYKTRRGFNVYSTVTSDKSDVSFIFSRLIRIPDQEPKNTSMHHFRKVKGDTYLMMTLIVLSLEGLEAINYMYASVLAKDFNEKKNLYVAPMHYGAYNEDNPDKIIRELDLCVAVPMNSQVNFQYHE